MFDPEFNLHTVLTSTGGAALCTVVSGPIAQEIGMSARHGVSDPGNRANATIGRAIRLVAMNVLGLDSGRRPTRPRSAIPGSTRSASPRTRRRSRGSRCTCSSATRPGTPLSPILPSEGPRQIAQQLTRSAELVLRTVASVIRSPATFSTGKAGQGMAVLGPEHAGFCVAEGGPSSRLREFLFRESRIAPDELLANGVQIVKGASFEETPDEEGKLRSVASPDDVYLVTAGGEGAGWSAWIQRLGAGHHRARDQSAGQADRRAAARLRPRRVPRPLGRN